MSDLKKKVGYLKGLAEGLNLDETSKEGRLFNSVFDVLDEMVVVIEQIVLSQLEMGEYLEMMDEDLGDLEDYIFGVEEEEDYFPGAELPELPEVGAEKAEETEAEIELACPHCFEVLDLEPSILDDEDVIEIICPNCEKSIVLNEEEQKKEEENTEQ